MDQVFEGKQQARGNKSDQGIPEKLRKWRKRAKMLGGLVYDGNGDNDNGEKEARVIEPVLDLVDVVVMGLKVETTASSAELARKAPRVGVHCGRRSRRARQRAKEWQESRQWFTWSEQTDE